MPVQAHEHEPGEQRQRDVTGLTRGRVTDREADTGMGTDGPLPPEDKDAVAGGLLHAEDGAVEPGDGVEEPAPAVDGEDVAVSAAGEDGEGGLVAVVGEEEVAGGGEAAPCAAHQAAAEEGFGGKPYQDVPDDEDLREGDAGAERRRESCRRRRRRHGCRRRQWSVVSDEARDGLTAEIPFWAFGFFFFFFFFLKKFDQ